MGGGSQESSSSSSTKESALSKEQLAILQQRESQYQQYFFPELVKGVTGEGMQETQTALMNQATGGINQQYNSAKTQFAQSMAQRGLSGSGVEAQGMNSLANTKSQSLANAFYNTQQQVRNEKLNWMQLALGMSPTPTTSAQYHQQSNSSSSGNSWGVGGLFS